MVPYWYLHPLKICPDQAVYLQMASAILSGQVPYRDFFDFNPPLIMYLSVIPVVVAKLLPWPVPLCFNFTVLGLTIFDTVLLSYLVVRNQTVFPLHQFLPVLFVFAAYGSSVVFDMGQREHLFVLLFLPYCFMRARSHFQAVAADHSPKWLRMLLGLMGGLALSLKPQFLLFGLALEAGLWLESKSLPWRTVETKTLAAVMVVYILAVLCLPGEALAIYLQEAVPVYLLGASWNGRCLLHMLLSYEYFREPVCLCLSTLLLSLVSRLGRYWAVFLLLSLVGFFHYLSGGQAWTYRLIPLQFFSTVLLAYLLGCYVHFALKGHKLAFSLFLQAAPVLPVASLFFCTFRIISFYNESVGSPGYDLSPLGYAMVNPRQDFDSAFFSMVSNSLPQEKVVSIGTAIRPGFPAQLQALRPPGSRYYYSSLVMLKEARERHPRHARYLLGLEAKQVAALGEDIRRQKPRLVYIQTEPMASILAPYDFNKYLEDYEPAGYVEGSQVYRRK